MAVPTVVAVVFVLEVVGVQPGQSGGGWAAGWRWKTGCCSSLSPEKVKKYFKLLVKNSIWRPFIVFCSIQGGGDFFKNSLLPKVL